MRSILKGINDTPLLLKGGTALLLAYGLDRFSEDLDFDAPLKLNLESRIRRSVPSGTAIEGIDLLKDTPTVTRYRVRYHSEHGKRSLKIEISYRDPPKKIETRHMNGIVVASLQRIVDQKLRAAYDGDDPRSKVRDLYDLDFIARRWPVVFNNQLASRLRAFAEDPDVLASRYKADYDEDDLIPDLIELEQLSLRLHCAAEEIVDGRLGVDRRIENIENLKNSSGATHVFWKHALEAIKAANAGEVSVYEADWLGAENSVIRECIINQGHSPEDVADALCMHSPGAVTNSRQTAIMAEIELLRSRCEHIDSSSVSRPAG